MKFFVSFLFIVNCFFLACFGQTAVIQSAADAYKHSQYAKAKQFIDEAAAYDKTSNDLKMWYYRGQIYLAIYRDTTELGKSEPDAAEKAAISFITYLKSDKAKDYDYYTDCNNLVWVAGVALYKKAGEALRTGDLQRATRFYNLIFDVIPFDKDNNLKRSNVTTESLNKNLYYVASKAKDNDKAKVYLQKLIDVKHNDPMIYLYMSRIYLQDKDTAKALAYVEKGRNLFEDNSVLMNEQINLYIAQGRTAELIDNLTKAIDGGQESENLYYVRGTLYQNNKDHEKAAADFKKAIELKPDFLDVYYRLGAMYFNEAIELAKSAANIKATDEFNKAKAAFEQKFKEAQPYLEKALEINPKKTEDEMATYKNTVKALTQLYARTNQMDKYNQIKETSEKK